jgi:hypothetical protein
MQVLRPVDMLPRRKDNSRLFLYSYVEEVDNGVHTHHP